MRGEPVLRRRDFLWSCAGLGFAACAGLPRLGRAPDHDALGSGDALALAARVRRGEVTPRELVEAAIRRIEARDPAVNAVTTRFFERA